jgi:hypothetical protein
MLKAFLYAWQNVDEHEIHVVLADTREEADEIARRELLWPSCKDLSDQYDRIGEERPLEKGVLF